MKPTFSVYPKTTIGTNLCNTGIFICVGMLPPLPLNTHDDMIYLTETYRKIVGL